MRKTIRTRRGMAGVLAMLYLVLFSTLAVGFYAATTTSVQVVRNEQYAEQAHLAAESGMQFIRYQLASLSIPHRTPQDQLFATVYTQLQERLNGTSNLGGHTLGISGDTISLPAGTDNYITLDGNGSRFRATIQQLGQLLRVKVVGQWSDSHGNAPLSRAVQMDYAVAQKASAIFDYGVASKSAIVMNGNTSIRGATNPANGSVLSTTYSTNTPLTMIGSSVISGDVSIVNPQATISVGASSSIAGSTVPGKYASHVHFGVEEPEFPTIDTTDFAAYATNVIATSNPAGRDFSNIRIKANTNPSFQANTTIRGVVYVETPNKISFGGNLTLQGVIVVQNNPTGTPATNVIDFGGNVNASGVETLPEGYGNLRKLTGSLLLAPNFLASFRGNFGTVGGSIIASKLDFTGNAGGTVKGSVINLDDTALSFSGTSDVIIESQGTGQYPAGVFFGSNYAPLPDTYSEVRP